MSKNRIKVPAVPVRTRAEMEILAGGIVELKNHQRMMTAQMDSGIKAVRDRYAADLGDLDKIIAEKMEIARGWADANPDEFGKAKSLDLAHAVIGFRTGQPQLKPLPKWTWDRVLERLRGMGAGALSYIRTKAEVDKQGLLAARHDLGEEQLRQIGVTVVQEETFFCEPKITAVEMREVVKS